LTSEEQYIEQYDTYEGSGSGEYQNDQMYGQPAQMQIQQQQYYQDGQYYQSDQDYPQEQVRWYDDGSKYEQGQGNYDGYNGYTPDDVPVEEISVDWEMKQEQPTEAEFEISELIEE
jgi:hypothetical protein